MNDLKSATAYRAHQHRLASIHLLAIQLSSTLLFSHIFRKHLHSNLFASEVEPFARGLGQRLLAEHKLKVQARMSCLKCCAFCNLYSPRFDSELTKSHDRC